MRIFRSINHFCRLDKIFPTLNFQTAKLYAHKTDSSLERDDQLIIKLEQSHTNFIVDEYATLKDLRVAVLKDNPSLQSIKVTNI
jgi:hypothetical protein